MMNASNTFDVVFVGAGHNALIAACYLVKEGGSVCLPDQRPAPGGWVHSEELTLPGFVHDADSALHPIFVNGPVFAELGAELAEYGLRFVQCSVSTGASFPDGRAAVIQTDPVAFSDELGRLGERQAWSQLMADVSPQLNSLLSLLGMDLASPEAAALLDTLRRAAQSALPFATLLTASGIDLLGERFYSEKFWLPALSKITQRRN
jgi:phytoene dehydrogenase-like protein